MTDTAFNMSKNAAQDAGGASRTAGTTHPAPPPAPPSGQAAPGFAIPSALQPYPGYHPPILQHPGFLGPPPGFGAPPAGAPLQANNASASHPGTEAHAMAGYPPSGAPLQANNPSAPHLGNEAHAMPGYPPSYAPVQYHPHHTQYQPPYPYYGNTYHPHYAPGPPPGAHSTAYTPAPHLGPQVKMEQHPPSPYLGLGQPLGPASRDRTPSGPPPPHIHPGFHPSAPQGSENAAPPPPSAAAPPPPPAAAPPPAADPPPAAAPPTAPPPAAAPPATAPPPSVSSQSTIQHPDDSQGGNAAPTMAYSLRKTISPRKGDDSAETQRVRRMREIRMSEQQELPQPQQPSSERPVPPTSSNMPANASSSFGPKSKAKWDNGVNITKEDLERYGLQPPQLFTPSKKGRSKSGRSQSAVPPSTPQHCTPKRANSAQPSTPVTTGDPFKHMGMQPGSPFRAFANVLGVVSETLDHSAPTTPGPSPPTEQSNPDVPPEEYKVGALTKDERQMVQQVAKEALKMLLDACGQINRPLDVLIHVLNKLVSNKITYTRSVWNYWVSYFWRHCREERARVDNPKAQPRDTFASFRELYPEWQEIIITDFHRAAAVEVETVGDRERTFKKWFSEMVDLAARGEELHGFQAILAACGESVNEDQALGQLHLSRNLEEEFLEKRLMMTEDALIGQMKTHSYDHVATQYAKQLAEDREERKQKKQAHQKKETDGQASQESSNSDNDEEEEDCNKPLLTRIQKLADKALTERMRELLSMDDAAINKITTDQGRKIVRDYLQALIRVEGGKLESVNLRWQDLPSNLASQGFTIVGWAHRVPFPDKDSRRDGIKSIGVDGVRKLVYGFRDGRIRIENKDATKLQNNKLPVAEEEAPPPDSRQARARRWFADGTSDNKGAPRLSAPEAKAGSSRSTTRTSGKKNAESSTRSVTFEEPPKPTTRASAKSSKSKGKRKASVVVSDSDDDQPLAPAPPSAPPAKSSSKSKPAVEKIHVKVGDVEVPVPFVDNSDDDIFELSGEESPSPVKRTSKRRRSLLSPSIEPESLAPASSSSQPKSASDVQSDSVLKSQQGGSTAGQPVVSPPRKRMMTGKEGDKDEDRQPFHFLSFVPTSSTSTVPSGPGSASASATDRPPAIQDPASLQLAHPNHSAPHGQHPGFQFYWPQQANYAAPPTAHGQGSGHLPPPNYHPHHQAPGVPGGQHPAGGEEGGTR